MRIALVYAAAGTTWIFGSSSLLRSFVHDPATVDLLEDLKGWAYVGITAFLLGLALDRYFATIRRAAERLTESEARLHVVSDNLPEGFVFQFARGDAGEPHFLYISAGVERVAGLSPEEVMADGARLFARMDPAEAEGYQAAEEKSTREMSDFSRELTFRRVDGTVRRAHVRSRPRRGPSGQLVWDGVILDVTERAVTEEALREREARLHLFVDALRVSEAQLGAAFEVASIGMAQADPKTGRWLRVNAKMSAITGHSSSELLDKTVWDLVVPEQRAEEEERFQALVKGHALGYGVERRYVRADGKLVWVHLHMTVIADADGAPMRAMATIEDVTERKELEARYQQAQKMEAVGRLAGGVAHDFNNILTSIIMQAELGMHEGIRVDPREAFEQIRSDAERAANLTRQLLVFSRRQVMQVRTVDANELVVALAKMLERIIGEDVKLELRLAPGRVVLRADAGMLDQVLMNLAVNARDAMPGGGTLTIATERIVADAALVRAHDEAKLGVAYAVLTVRDAGQGIAADVMPRIFEPFFTTKEAGKGTGLGLATVFGIVQQHHGWIDVESALGRGTTFHVFLPGEASEDARPSSPPRPANLRGHETILLAEDDPAVRIAASTTLEHHGYAVLVAEDGPRAIELWQRHRDDVALLLTDVVMPGGMDGRALAERLREDVPALEVVFVSGYAPELAGREVAPRGHERFLQKPLRAAELLSTVRSCLDARRESAR